MTSALAEWTDWRRDGCGERCVQRWHDLAAHERYGYRQGVASMTPRIVRTGPLVVDLDGMTVTVDGVPAALTDTEFRLLAFYASRIGRTVHHDDVIREVWPAGTLNPHIVVMGGDRADYHCLRTHVCRLRAKLREARGLLVTVESMRLAYRLEEVES